MDNYLCDHPENPKFWGQAKKFLKQLKTHPFNFTKSELFDQQIPRIKDWITISQSCKGVCRDDTTGGTFPLFYFIKDNSATPSPFLDDYNPTTEAQAALQALYQDTNGGQTLDANTRRGYYPIESKNGLLQLSIYSMAGHQNASTAPVISSDISKNKPAVTRFFQAYSGTIQKVGAWLDRIDNPIYVKYKTTYLRHIADKAAWFLRSSKRACFLGLTVIFGYSCGPHTDDNDLPEGWVITVASGKFQGGIVYLPSIGVRIRQQPGDILFLRTKTLVHCIEPVKEGYRMSTVFHTHGNLHSLGQEN